MENKKTIGQSIWELVLFVFIAVIVILPFRIFIAQPFIVSGSSMVPTFENGQYLIVDELSYKISTPKRDDVVVFKYPNDTTKYFIKRIIGLPGETVDVTENDVTITNKEHPDGFKLDQPFVKNIGNSTTHFQLKDDEYFVMGDNRPNSYDSRNWGPVAKKLLMGKPFIRLFPFSKINILPGSYKQAE